MTDPTPPPQSQRPDVPRGAARAPLKRTRGPVSSLAVVAAGMFLIAFAAWIDARDADAPWSGAVFSPDSDPMWEGTIPIRARRLPLINYPLRQSVYTELRKRAPRDLMRALGLDRTEWLIVLYAPPETLQPLLESGRMPIPGRPEVLAGALAKLSEIHADDGHFHVVGRLSRTAGGLATAYVIPADENWEPLFERTMAWGWLDPEGSKSMAEMDDVAPHEDLELHGGLIPARTGSSWLTLWGLALAIAGGAGLHRAIFARIRRGVFAPACRSFTELPGVVRGLHLVLYAGLFSSMAAALAFPDINLVAMNYITHEFSEGELGYIGAAYRSGNVPAAAAATWVNNYLWQTVVLTVGVSLVIPAIGILKTLASFVLAGVGMSPLWSGTASGYTFHSITMVLELEAYVYACAAVAIFWLRIVRAARQGDRTLAAGNLRMLASATLLAGAMLAVAGLYEAATLILLR